MSTNPYEIDIIQDGVDETNNEKTPRSIQERLRLARDYVKKQEESKDTQLSLIQERLAKAREYSKKLSPIQERLIKARDFGKEPQLAMTPQGDKPIGLGGGGTSYTFSQAGVGKGYSTTNAAPIKEKFELPTGFADYVDEFDKNIDKAIEEKTKELQQLSTYGTNDSPALMPVHPELKDDEEYKGKEFVTSQGDMAKRKQNITLSLMNLSNTKDLTKYTKMLLDPAVTVNSKEAAVKGLFTSTIAKDIFTGGFQEMFREMNVAGISQKAERIEKRNLYKRLLDGGSKEEGLKEKYDKFNKTEELTLDEQATLEAYSLLEQARAGVETSSVYEMFSIVNQMLPYAFQMAATSPVSSGAKYLLTKSAKGLVKKGIKSGYKPFLKGLIKYKKNAALNTIAKYGKDSWVYTASQLSRLPFMPMTHYTYAKEKIGEIDPATNRPVIGSIPSDKEAFWNTVIIVAPEVWSEGIGEYMRFGKVSDMIKSFRGKTGFLKNIDELSAKYSKLSGSTLRTKASLKATPVGYLVNKAQFDGGLREWGEELIGGTMNWIGEKAFTDKDPEEWWNWRDQWVTFASMNIMGGVGYAGAKYSERGRTTNPEEYYNRLQMGELNRIANMDDLNQQAEDLMNFFIGTEANKDLDEKQIKKQRDAAQDYIAEVLWNKSPESVQDAGSIQRRRLQKDAQVQAEYEITDNLIEEVRDGDRVVTMNDSDGVLKYLKGINSEIVYAVNSETKEIQPLKKKPTEGGGVGQYQVHNIDDIRDKILDKRLSDLIERQNEEDDLLRFNPMTGEGKVIDAESLEAKRKYNEDILKQQQGKLRSIEFGESGVGVIELQEDGSWKLDEQISIKKDAKAKAKDIQDDYGDAYDVELFPIKADPNDKLSRTTGWNIILREKVEDKVETKEVKEEESETKEEVKEETEQPKAKEETKDAKKVGKETTKTGEQEKPERGKQGQVRVRDNEKGGVEAQTREKQKTEVKETPKKSVARDIIGEKPEIQEKETKKIYVARILNQINKKAKSAGKLVVVENSNDKGLSKPVKDKLSKSVAVYSPKTKTVFVNTEKIQDKELTPEFLFDLWLHEMGVHHGIENIYEFKDKKAIAEKITSDIGRDVIIERINELRKEKGFAALKDTDKIDDFVLGEEYMAYLSGKVISGQDLTPAERSVWQKVVDEVIKQINKLLGTDIKFTDADIARIIRASVRSNFVEPVKPVKAKQGELFAGEQIKEKEITKKVTKEAEEVTKQPKPTPKKSGVDKEVTKKTTKKTEIESPKVEVHKKEITPEDAKKLKIRKTVAQIKAEKEIEASKPNINNPNTTFAPKEKLTQQEADKRSGEARKNKLGARDEKIQKSVDKMLDEHTLRGNPITVNLVKRYAKTDKKQAEIIIRELEQAGLITKRIGIDDIYDATGLGKDVLYQMEAETEAEEMRIEKVAEGKEEELFAAKLAESASKFISPEMAKQQLRRLYDPIENTWYGRRDRAIFEATGTAWFFQEQLKKAWKDHGGVKSPWKTWRKLNNTLHIYMDMVGNPNAEQRFNDAYDMLYLRLINGDITQEQYDERIKKWDEYKKEIELTKQLTQEQKDIAKDIMAEYKKLGEVAKDFNVITDIINNYVARVWVFKNTRKKDNEHNRFQLSTRYARQRIFPSILDAVVSDEMQDAELAIKGATANLHAAQKAIHTVIANRRLIQEGKNLKNEKGDPIFTTNSKKSGYKEIENPLFTDWKMIPQGKNEDGKTVFSRDAEKGEESVYRKNYRKVVGRNGKVTEYNAEVFYAPEYAAKRINNATMPSKLADLPLLKQITIANAVYKRVMLSWSLFHHQAFLRSFMLGGAIESNDMNFVNSWKEGLMAAYDKNHKLNPLLDKLVYNGLTLGLIQEWDRSAAERKTIIGRRLDEIPGAGWLKDKFIAASDWWTDILFQKMGAGLKAKAAILEYQKALSENPFEDPDIIARRVAKLVNADFGGLHLERMGRNPTWQHIFRLFILAPDWCLDSDTQAFTKSGWKYHYELTVGKDEILAFNPDTKKYQWSKLNDMYVNEDYDGEILSVNNHNRAIKMTPNHKCYVWNISKKKYEVVKAYEINSAHRIPRSAGFDYPDKGSFSDEFIHLVGWVVTDGYFKKSKFKLANGKDKVYLSAKITQAKPKMVKHLKELGLGYHVEKKLTEHDGIKMNYPKYVFTPSPDVSKLMLKENLHNGLSWEFLSKLTKLQLKILYDAMMMGDGTGQNRFCGKEKEVFYMTMVQTMLGESSTFYQQEKNCWRTRILSKSKKYISCHKKTTSEHYKGTIWCPSVDTGFWLANRGGLTFITGNTESNFQTVIGAIKKGSAQERAMYRDFWKRIIVRGALTTTALNLLLALWDDPDDKETYWDTVRRRYKQAWEAGYLRWLMVDVTPIYRHFTDDVERRSYFSIYGHFLDPIKWIIHPLLTTKHKSSVFSKIAADMLSGQDWKGDPYTTDIEFTGLDEKGFAKRDKIIYNKDGSIDWDNSVFVGDRLGGQYKWRTNKREFGAKATPLVISLDPNIDQSASFIIGTIRDFFPIPAGKALSYAMGDMTGYEALLSGFGFHTSGGRNVSPYATKEEEYLARRNEGRYADEYVGSLLHRSTIAKKPELKAKYQQEALDVIRTKKFAIDMMYKEFDKMLLEQELLLRSASEQNLPAMTESIKKVKNGIYDASKKAENKIQSMEFTGNYELHIADDGIYLVDKKTKNRVETLYTRNNKE